MGTWFKLLPVMATLALVAALVVWSARNPLYVDGPSAAPAIAAR
jgi:hypothetical protein